MKILVVGGGGREHALVWKLKQSSRVDAVFCAPGNAGIAHLATCVDIAAEDIEKLATFAKTEGIDLTVVGPEVPLTMGIVDRFEAMDLRVFGTSQAASILEGSKVFTKDLLAKYNIPAGHSRTFTDRAEAINYIEEIGTPLVVKADGLAAGKGVIVAHTVAEAISAVELIMADKAFGEAGDRLLVEEFLVGEEASFIAFTDGETILPLPTSQDHKAAYDGDKGPNTGGMGAYSPAPVVTAELHRQAMEEVMLPTIRAMAAEGRPYKGILYAGLMIHQGKAKVLEFNSRFGDPEAQPLLMRLQTDLVEIMEAVIDGNLAEITLEVDPRPTVCVVMAAGGYPGSYEKGRVIEGLAAAAELDDVVVFHAGTAQKDDKIVSAGGRVLGITAIGENLAGAISKAYAAVDCIRWQDCFYRKDIGQKALRRGQGFPLVSIVMGSDSDLPVMQACADFLKKMDVPYEMTVASAHRTPARAAELAATARDRGVKLIVAAAGMAAHLAGVLAAHTTLPVIGVPIDASSLNGLDALLSTVQMPPGVPVATMGIGKAGAKNAGILACQILSLADPQMVKKLATFKEEMAAEVDAKALKVESLR